MDQINTNIKKKAPSVVNVLICFTETLQKNIVKKFCFKPICEEKEKKYSLTQFLTHDMLL